MEEPKWGGRRSQQVTAAFKAECEAVNAVCWLCHQPIDYQARSGTMNAFELDHYHPRSDYPELAWEESNFRPSHASCNRSRGKKGAPALLGPLTASW